MVTVLPKEEGWSDAFRQIGSGLSEGYIGRSDENAIRKSIMDLGEKPSGRQILDALTNTKTYSNESKQQALSNYLGVERFEQLQKNYQIEQDREDRDRKRRTSAAIELTKNSTLPDEAKERIIGALDSGEIDPGGIGEIVNTNEKANKKTPAEVEQANKQKTIKEGLKTIKRMREIGSKGRLGIGSNITRYFSDAIQEDYGEYEQSGKSLIQLSTNIPIRNQREFNILAENLYDPSIPDSQRKGILNALQNILEGSLDEQVGQDEALVQESNAPTERKPLSAFRR
jgi:hypothetical protein